MNLTPLGHAAVALIAQIIIVLPTGNWWAGAATGAFFYIGREITQAEYRWISEFGGDKRANMPWWGAFDPRVWSKLDCWLDWVVPTLAVLSSTVAARFFF